jgi:hypothetical protein
MGGKEAKRLRHVLLKRCTAGGLCVLEAFSVIERLEFGVVARGGRAVERGCSLPLDFAGSLLRKLSSFAKRVKSMKREERRGIRDGKRGEKPDTKKKSAIYEVDDLMAGWAGEEGDECGPTPGPRGCFLGEFLFRSCPVRCWKNGYERCGRSGGCHGWCGRHSFQS